MKCKEQHQFLKSLAFIGLTLLLTLGFAVHSQAVQVFIPDVPGYGYNSDRLHG